MTQILKRLEIIKSSIAIEDAEIVELQIAKLQRLDVDDKVQDIIDSLESSEYSKAIAMIEAYLSKYSGVVVYEDKEIASLKLELKTIENILQKLIEQKTELLCDIEEFNREYNLRLGGLIRRILSLNEEILYKKVLKKAKQKEKYKEDIKTFKETKANIDELKASIAELEEALREMNEDDDGYEEIRGAYDELRDELDKLKSELKAQEEELKKTRESVKDESIKEEYEKAKSEYKKFDNEYESIKENQKATQELDEDEKALLKQLFRKAARLCHPDIVPDELKEQAHKLMQQLNDAYAKKDLSEVKKILLSLENGSGFELSSESINDKELLRAKVNEYRQNIADTEDEINAIREDEIYRLISELDDWDEYFEEAKKELEAEIDRLEKELSEILEENKADTKTKKPIQPESSPYAKHILSIDNPSFEKIRRYCNNLLDDGKADEMQKNLAENGKMYKALIYDALEQFLSKLDGQTVTLIDWGCAQGTASMLALDYIREKQLDIEVDKVVLIDDDTKALSRAIANTKAISKSVEAIALNSDNEDTTEQINALEANTTLNLFANDKMPIGFLEIDFDILGEAYFLCVSNESREFVDDVYENISDFNDAKKISFRDDKIGRFQRFERVFAVTNNQSVKIYDDEIPF